MNARAVRDAALAGVVCLLTANPLHGHGLYISYASVSVADGQLLGKLSVNKLDLLTTLESGYGKPLYTVVPETLDSLVADYLSKTFRVWTNGERRTLEVLDRGQEKDTVSFDLAFPLLDPIESMKVRNTILCDDFPGQINILVLETPREGKQTWTFSCSEPEKTLSP